MNGKIPKTNSEIIIWINGIVEKINEKIDNIEKQIIEIKRHPDDMGKWAVRLIAFATLVILIYNTFIK